MKKYLISLTLINVSSLGFGVVLGLFCFYYFKLFIKKNISFVYHSLFFFSSSYSTSCKKKRKIQLSFRREKGTSGTAFLCCFLFCFFVLFLWGFCACFLQFQDILLIACWNAKRFGGFSCA